MNELLHELFDLICFFFVTRPDSESFIEWKRISIEVESVFEAKWAKEMS